MADTDEFSLYGSMEHTTFEFQRIERQREVQVARVMSWIS